MAARHLLRAPGSAIVDGGKIVSAADAVRLVRDGDTVATSGFVGIGFAEEIAIALEQRFLDGSGPSDLTLVYAAGRVDASVLHQPAIR